MCIYAKKDRDYRPLWYVDGVWGQTRPKNGWLDSNAKNRGHVAVETTEKRVDRKQFWIFPSVINESRTDEANRTKKHTANMTGFLAESEWKFVADLTSSLAESVAQTLTCTILVQFESIHSVPVVLWRSTIWSDEVGRFSQKIERIQKQ